MQIVSFFCLLDVSFNLARARKRESRRARTRARDSRRDDDDDEERERESVFFFSPLVVVLFFFSSIFPRVSNPNSKSQREEKQYFEEKGHRTS